MVLVKQYLHNYRYTQDSTAADRHDKDCGSPIMRKTYRYATSLSEVLIGLFMFLLGIVSLIFLGFYMYSRILNGGTRRVRWKEVKYQQQKILPKWSMEFISNWNTILKGWLQAIRNNFLARNASIHRSWVCTFRKWMTLTFLK